MEFENNSDFIKRSNTAEAELLEQCGTTSLAYKINVNGQLFFMKRLRPELRNDTRVRELFYKEYNTGRSIDSPYIVKYLEMKDGANGLYIVMEYVNGHTLKEKVEREPGYFKHSGNIERFLLQLCEASRRCTVQTWYTLTSVQATSLSQEQATTSSLLIWGTA